MALRFFADHCVANAIAVSLLSSGHLVLRLRDYLPTDAPDPMVIAKAQSLDAILLSINGDFADIINYPPHRFNGIIALRVRNHPQVTAQVSARLVDYLAMHPNPDHYIGKLFIVESHQIRIRGG